MTLYTDHDPAVCAWLRQLVADGNLPPGRVLEKSITEIRRDELDATQVHHFAGIGGWPLALRLAGIPDDFPLWTGSCPCQPFSSAGKRKGTDDPRHLWPAFRDLIAQRLPPVIFGEQVASGAGRDWLAGVRADLEGLGYEVGAADLCAAGVGAPHIRQRLYWGAVRVADAQPLRAWSGGEGGEGGSGSGWDRPAIGRPPRRLGDVLLPGLEGHPRDGDDRGQPGRLDPLPSRPAWAAGAACGVEHPGRIADERRGDGGELPGPTSRNPGPGHQRERHGDAAGDSGQAHRLADSDRDGCGPAGGGLAECGQRDPQHGRGADGLAVPAIELGDGRRNVEIGGPERRAPDGGPSPWSDYAAVWCRDGKARRVPTQPAFFPLAHGVPARVVRLRGYGNAIVPQVAATFVRAFLAAVLEQLQTSQTRQGMAA